MAVEIKFGTSGWRAIVAEEFTLANIRRAVTGIASYVASQPGSHRVLVGRDPRFLVPDAVRQIILETRCYAARQDPRDPMPPGDTA